MAEGGERVGFKLKTIEEFLKLSFKDKTKSKINNDGLKLISEVVRVFVVEGAARAAAQAKGEGETEITLEHLEKILPQLDGRSYCKDFILRARYSLTVHYNFFYEVMWCLDVVFSWRLLDF